MRKVKLLAAVSILLVVAAACSKSEPKSEGGVSLGIGKVASSIRGNVVSLPIDVEGIKIVKADGDSSGDSGHFHVFVDSDPVAAGEVIPKSRTVIHSADNPVKIWGLPIGEHTFTVVLGNGVHQRILGNIEDSVTVDVKGPSVQGTAPATLKKGEDLKIALSAEGVKVLKADGDVSKETGHFHVIVDPATPPKGGDVIPAAEPNKVIHTADPTATVSGLAVGEHIIWIVLGDGTHRAFDPAVMDKITVTVS